MSKPRVCNLCQKPIMDGNWFNCKRCLSKFNEWIPPDDCLPFSVTTEDDRRWNAYWLGKNRRSGGSAAGIMSDE